MLRVGIVVRIKKYFKYCVTFKVTMLGLSFIFILNSIAKKDQSNVNMLFIIQKVHTTHFSEIKCNINRNFMQSLLFVWFTELSANHLLPMIIRKSKKNQTFFFSDSTIALQTELTRLKAPLRRLKS